MAAKKTLYVPDQDTDKWKELEELSGESSSAVVGRLLGAELERLREAKKARDGKYSRLVVSYEDEGIKRKVAFVGRWIVKDYYATGYTYSVALTEKGGIFVLTEHNLHGDGYSAYESFQAFKEDEEQFPAELLAQVAAGIGEDYIEELDI